MALAKKTKQTIEVGDLVRLKTPYKVEDYRHNKVFLAALNGGSCPEEYISQYDIFENWAGFTHGIIHQILDYEADGANPHRLALYLYYPQENGVWLSFGLNRGILTCVDFSTSEVELIFKSSAPDYVSGQVN